MSIEVTPPLAMDADCHKTPARYVPNRSQLDAYKALQDAMRDGRGMAMLHGPEASGRRAVCNQFIRELDAEIVVARIDGRQQTPSSLLADILAEFGLGAEFATLEEMKKVLGAYSAQQLCRCGAPILVIEDLDKMSPGALQAICDLAELRTRQGYVLRFVLVSTQASDAILAATSLKSIANRLVVRVGLAPMSLKETVNFLYSNLSAESGTDPERVFPYEACVALYSRSGGWPTTVLALAAAMIRNADSLPVSPDDLPEPQEPAGPAIVDDARGDDGPRLVVTLDGKVVQDVELDKPVLLVGRSRRCDIRVDGPTASNFHCLILRDVNGTAIADLNSENGTFVNGQRVTDFELRHLDVIALGDHRIKLFDAGNRGRRSRGIASLVDTVVLDDSDAVRQSVAVGSLICLATARGNNGA